MFQPRLGVSWDPGGDGQQVLRFSTGLFYARVPGLSLASSRSTNGSRGQTLYRDSTFNGFGVTPPTWPNLIPQSEIANPDHPDVFVFDKDFRNPRTWSSTVAYERELMANLSASVTYTHSDTDFITRFINRNDPVFGSPWSTGLGAGGTNGIATLTVVESSAKSRYDGVTFGLNKKYAQNYQFQVNYTLSRDLSDDDNERDPFTFRYARADTLEPEYNYSDRDQRHRFNGWFLTTWRGFEFTSRISGRTAQPKSIGNTPQDRILARRVDREAQHAQEGQRVLHLGPAPVEGLHLRADVDPADRRDLQLDQQQEHQASGGHQPGVQLRRHGAERPRRSAAAPGRGARAVLSVDASMLGDLSIWRFSI